MSGVRDILQDRELFHVGENDTVASVVRRMAEIRVGQSWCSRGNNCGACSASGISCGAWCSNGSMPI